MADTTIWIKIETKKADLRRKLEGIVRSIEGMKVQVPNDTRRADLLIFEMGDDIDNEFQHIRSLLNSDEVAEVFLISKNSDPAMLMQAIKIGAKEFFLLPLKEEEVKQALKELKKRIKRASRGKSPEIGQIITIFGSKGGVGATTVAVNLAVNLAQKESVKSVALIDMNMMFGEIPLFLELDPGYHWGEIVKNISRLDSTFLMNILAKHSSGVHVLPSPATLSDSRSAIPDMMSHLIGFMQKLFDFVIIDAGQFVDEISLKIMELSDNILLISLLSLPCISNANKILQSISELKTFPEERIKIVINRYLSKSDIPLNDAEESVHKKTFWTIPNDYGTTVSAINNGTPLYMAAPKAQITRSLNDLADTFVEKEDHQKKWWQILTKR
ncbi:MAG: AAA family ATPase [Deltaproteobacteria bacterium]|jgi:pilus assembly protein CpaE|nr:AAA family ATPase [Deltaproteobacteria bacterium]MDL1986172.1 AAA family ATPase [Deltaproteobacteria bacterium]